MISCAPTKRGIPFRVAVMAALLSALLLRAARAEEDDGKRYVFLIHGLMSHPILQLRMEHRLEKAGFVVVNKWYPTQQKTIQQHAADLAKLVQEKTASEPDAEVNFVTHSMGALVARYYLTHHDCPGAKRMVMVTPPNSGAFLADQFEDFILYRLFVGDKAAVQLGTNGIHKECGIPKIEFGIIAGGRGDGKGYSFIVPGDDDGTIGVVNTRLKGEKDFILLHHQHTMMILHDDTIENVIHFLNHGRFIHEEEAAEDERG